MTFEAREQLSLIHISSGDGLVEEGGVNMWRAVIVVGIVFALLAYACIVVGARSEDCLLYTSRCV